MQGHEGRRLDRMTEGNDIKECEACGHMEHDPGACSFLFIYARGPNDPPGNQGCLCGHDFKVTTTYSNLSNEKQFSILARKNKESG